MFRNFLFVIILASISSCEKENDKVNLNVSGTWELFSAHGWLGTVTFQPGNGNLLIFQSNGYLERREPGLMPEIGQYSLSKKSDCVQYSGGNKTILKFHFTGYTPQYYAEIKDDKLHLDSELCVADGGQKVYRRI